MLNLAGREHRILDLSKVRDSRRKDAGISVNEDNRARCSAAMCEWIVSANTAHGGSSPFPYGLYILQGDATIIPDLPTVLQNTAFLEVVPCDRADRRAAKLLWNETGTEADFSFVAVASILSINAPRGTTLWLEAVITADDKGAPVALFPLGEHIQRQAVQSAAVGSAPAAP